MKKLFAEMTIREGAKRLGIDDCTLSRWLNQGKAPFSYKGTRRIVRSTVIDKIEMAMARHGSEWFKYTTWTPFDRFDFETVSLDKVVPSEPTFDPQPQQLEMRAANSSKAKELAGIAKQLQKLNEHELASTVLSKAVEIM